MAPVSKSLSKAQRFEIFRDRLNAAPAAKSMDAARALLERVLIEVEDEFSGVPNNIASSESDGRMYPPLDDRRRTISIRPRIDRFESAGHSTFIAGNGAIKIVRRRDGNVDFDKPGSDGRTIDKL